MPRKTAQSTRIEVERDPDGKGWVIRVGGKVKERAPTKRLALVKVDRLAGAPENFVTEEGGRAGVFRYLELGKSGRRSQPDPIGSSYPVRLDAARAVLGSDAKVADALGVARSQVKRWGEGTTEPSLENADRVIALDAVVALLSGHLEPSSITKWLNGINAHLGNRKPVELLREGNLSDVIAAIEALKSGSYA